MVGDVHDELVSTRRRWFEKDLANRQPVLVVLTGVE